MLLSHHSRAIGYKMCTAWLYLIGSFMTDNIIFHNTGVINNRCVVSALSQMCMGGVHLVGVVLEIFCAHSAFCSIRDHSISSLKATELRSFWACDVVIFDNAEACFSSEQLITTQWHNYGRNPTMQSRQQVLRHPCELCSMTVVRHERPRGSQLCPSEKSPSIQSCHTMQNRLPCIEPCTWKR